MTDFDSLGSPAKGGVEAELQDFLLMEKQRLQVTQQVLFMESSFGTLFLTTSCPFQIHQFNDICWEKCVDKPGSKFDSKTETCLTNCVDRFIDVSLLITNRFAQILQKSAGQGGGL